ncbi:MAG: sigma-70 family RNA polymerase sigma factor [Candidatus Tectomicrobia bacterium]|nr:sigma-70 family RNA polymerase sigma factor [Candidatus Tectomicrobia bacterium]
MRTLLIKEGAIETPDERIRAAIVAQDYHRALDVLVRVFQHEIVGYCVNMLGDAQQGAEVAQNVFLGAYTALARFRGDASIRTWLFAIARKQCLKAMKQAARRQVMPPSGADAESSPEALLLDLEEEALWERRQAQLSRFLQRLKKREKDILLMYYYKGQTYADIAAKLWVSETTARRRVQRALQQLEEMIDLERF